MANTFPFPIDFTPTKEEIKKYADEDIPKLDGVQEASGSFDVTSFDTGPARAGSETKVYKLATIGNWPEFKTEWKVRCKFGICTKVPVAYRRHCTKFAYVKVTYPTGQEDEIKDCIAGSALASAVAAVISGGAAGAAVFERALQLCLEVKGYDWANGVRVGAGWDSECGKWTPY